MNAVREDQPLRPAPTSGFPEWLPELRMVELGWLDHIRTTFEAYGFASIETPSVEALDVLTKKGETSQEVYTLHRLQADPDDDSDARLGLHFDLTVPFARYTAQHFNDLVFPFKRYQIQRVWRGERPQAGRFREFVQCDIDVINVDRTPLYFDAEMPRIVHEILTALRIGEFRIHVNNRKILEGFFTGLGIADPVAVIRALDKLDKLGIDRVARSLSQDLKLDDAQVASCLKLAGIRGEDSSVVEEIRGLGVHSDLLAEGLSELAFVLDALADLPRGSVIADLSVARGLDYYTGTVYEGRFVEFPDFGSICSGGRYENLAGAFIRRALPGVGISIGLTRIFAKLAAEGRLPIGPKSPTQVLVAAPTTESFAAAVRTAARLRGRGIRTEVYHQPDKLQKQLRYALRKGIPYVWFPPTEEGAGHEVKALDSAEQVAADPESWAPRVGVVGATEAGG
ncbi:histidine--tRNA ligase [Streptomyces sp. SID3343]|uniref:histidine--tRNA ligase n=1 Tax=Streptomyces sp. SID3343 TaxID=2690260 RepID=UPI0013686833|nr:histidine--tRNA ligase [Streptomyces sp. SID3343]MYW01906.1 histidine--tRNA ligase [Streptomyces sp. SID3343]